MKYSTINPKLFIENRKRFREKLKPNSMALFVSNDIMPTNGDGVMGFVQNADLFYLSGIDQEESTLLIQVDKNRNYKEILFIRKTDNVIAQWEGEKLSKEEATEVSGITQIYWNDEFKRILEELIFDVSNIYLNSNEHPRKDSKLESAEDRFSKELKQRFHSHNFEKAAPIMHELRMIKSDIEIDLIRTACKITHKGFNRVLNFVKPGVMEYEIEAELIHEFISNRSKGFAYQPIVASGKNACILHYIANNQPCNDGDIILIDAAAEYANYASDLTRSIPVSGKFSPRQKEVYNAVLRVMKNAIKMLVPGNTIPNYHKEVGKFMEKELVGLGLLSLNGIKRQSKDAPAYKKYFMHGTSHFLGIDVHDVGNYEKPIEEGMVFTCEPGIYIPEEGLGIRLENDILVTDSKPIDLMEEIAIEVEEIESLMAG